MDFLLSLIAALVVGGLIYAFLRFFLEPRLAVGAQERQEEADRRQRERFRQSRVSNEENKAAMRVALAKKTEGVQGMSTPARQDFFGNYESQIGKGTPPKTVKEVLTNLGDDEEKEEPIPAPRQQRVQPVRTTKAQRKKK